MASSNCTNIRAAQATKSQSVYVTLSGAESLSIMPLVSLGLACTISSSNKTGYVDFVDTLGHVFRIKPVNMTASCDSDTAGILKVNELITINY